MPAQDRLVQDLPTPCLLVERTRLDANLAAMQALAERENVALRPHAKTHKSPDLGRLQLERGAVGLTVATPAEAEAFAAAGFTDLLLAREVAHEADFERLFALVERGVRLQFLVDTESNARLASRQFSERGLTADVLIEVDTGQGRCGVPWFRADEALTLARSVRAQPGLDLRGLLTHGGHSYNGPRDAETPVEALERAMREERDRLLDVAAHLGAAGVLSPGEHTISLGSTPTMSRFQNAERGGFRVTEIRPGNYVFHDGQQLALGAAALAQCALTVQTTVFSKHRDDDGTERAFCDAGKKAMTTELGWGVVGHGVVLYSPRTMVPNPHAQLAALSEEHGWLLSPGGSIYDVGDQVRIIPNHACTAVALQDRLYLVDGDDVLAEWPVVARSASGVAQPVA